MRLASRVLPRREAGALFEKWVFGSAPFLANMGHARNRPKRLAEKLLQIRKALGLSQKEMAERLGIEKSYNIVSKYERGKSLPTLREIVAYSRVVNIHSEQIVDDDLDLNL